MNRAHTTLPIDSLRRDVLGALRSGHLVVTAATGTGKSTRLPVWAAENGRVLVVEPRRIAAISLAQRVADNEGCPVGGRVGYAVRQDPNCNDRTEIVFVTPGVALNWLINDGLARFTTVILDEFHERRWDTDLLLALLRLREQHRLILTSATLEGERLAAHLDANHLEADGVSHPVTVSYRAENPRAMPTADQLPQRMAETIREVVAESRGDVLAFLPGQGEIRGTAEQLRRVDAEVVALHGSASAHDQRRALETGERRRIVLATNVAETSLTVPGVTTVVDSGLERRTQQRNGRTVLALNAVAQTNADQRKGRAGRVAPGQCIRLWGAQAPLSRISPPETQREDLTDLVLAAAAAGQPATTLMFPDPPAPAALARAEARLHALGALDGSGHATPLGRAMFTLPVDTLFASLIFAMPDDDSRGFMVDLAAALSAGRGMVQTPTEPDQRERLARTLGRRCDATLLVSVLRGCALADVSAVPRPHQDAQRLAQQIRNDLRLDAMPDSLSNSVVTRALDAAIAAAPALVFLRRARRRDALGNGSSEIHPGRRTLFGDQDDAAVVLDDHSVPGRGTRQTVTVGTCMAPIPTAAIVNAGIADVSTSRPGISRRRLTCQQQWRYAGRVLQERDVEPEGSAAREAIAELVLADRLLKPAGRRLRDDLEAWWLYQQLELGEEAEPLEPQAWLLERLRALGVGHGDDLALLEPGDLRFHGIPDWERDRFDSRYPRTWSLHSLELRLHYEPRRRRVTAEQIGGTRRNPPQRWELPAWPGWTVRFRKASREMQIR